MKTSNQLLLLGMLSALSAAATAADAAGQGAVDTSKWKCESCKFEQGVSGTLDVGAGSVSDKSAEFGQYNGLYKKGGFFIGDGAVRSRGEDGAYWNFDASNLGLDSRALNAEGGKQGSYKLRFKYDETPHRIWDGALTPYAGSGGASLTLPAGFPAATTGAMPLAGTLQQADLYTQRNQLGVGASWNRSREWEYAVNFRHDTREGNILRTGGAFFVNTAQLIEPVDYVTDQVDASASYTGKKYQLKFAYYGSKFRNDNHALTWQDPYTAINGETLGQLALPPDNQFHQVSASAGYQFSDKTRASADIAFGRMTQNESFLASTQNAALVVPGLPSASLNGRAKTLDANLKLSSAVTDRLRLQAIYTHNDRDNQTPQAAYPSVATDMFVEAARTNLPYSFTQDKLKLSADYRASAKLRGSIGADFDAHKRTFQEVEKTREDTAWGKVSSRITDKVDLTFKLAHGERRNAGSYQIVPEITPAENPLLRRFNMANRTRETAGLRADIALAENVSLGLGLDSSEDKYKDSTIGLTKGKDLNFSGDISAILTERTRLHFFANRQEIKSNQAGSQTFSVPDWSADSKDTIDTYGLGVKHAAIPDKLDIGADYGITRSRSEINVNTGASNPAFPHVTAKLDSLKLYATYRMKENMSLQAGYWYERYDSRDWMLDGVAPDTIPNVLTLGLQAPQYHVNVVRLSLRYKF
ncbi:MAG: MtrB/PioB family decaheme-associated outer membrane protein [Burkholderiales bacterium]